MDFGQVLMIVWRQCEREFGPDGSRPEPATRSSSRFQIPES